MSITIVSSYVQSEQTVHGVRRQPRICHFNSRLREILCLPGWVQSSAIRYVKNNPLKTWCTGWTKYNNGRINVILGAATAIRRREKSTAGTPRRASANRPHQHSTAPPHTGGVYCLFLLLPRGGGEGGVDVYSIFLHDTKHCIP